MRDIFKEVRSESTQILDKDTGELIDISVNKVNILIDKDEFALVYAKFWDVLLNKKTSPFIEMLAYLIKNYSSGQIFSITEYLKKEVAEKSGRSFTSYHAVTKKLIDSGFIIAVGSRTYRINPLFVYKGSTNNRKKAIFELFESN